MNWKLALVIICLLIVPEMVDAQQISPVSNPTGSTITVDTADFYNWQTPINPFLNSGTINITSAGTLTNQADSVSFAEVLNSGTLNNSGFFGNASFGPDSFALFKNITGQINNQQGGQFQNAGSLISNGTFINNGGSTLINSLGGTIASSGTLTFHADSAFDNTGGTLKNSGIIKSHIDDLYFGAGGVIEFESGSHYVNHAQISVDAATSLSNAQTMTNYGDLSNAGSLDNSGKLINLSTLTFLAGSVSGNTGNLNSHATLNNNSGSTLTNHGTLNSTAAINNSGSLNNLSTLSIRPAATMNNSGSLYNSGTLTIDAAITLSTHAYLYYQTIAKTGARSLVESSIDSSHYAMGAYVGDGVLVNDGTLTNEGTLMNDGVLDTRGGTFINEGTLNGVGLIQGSFTDHGKIQPGNSTGVIANDEELSNGVITIDGDLSKVEGSMVIELAGVFDGGDDKSSTKYDWLDVTGNVDLAGTLDVELIDGFQLADGMTFDIVRVGGTLTGQYDGLGEGALVSHLDGQDLFITYAGGNGNHVSLYTVPEPTLALTWSMVIALGLAVRRRR